MGQTVALSKVLHIREQEKKNAQLTHHNAMEFFEDVATQLYKLLRKKEAAEESYEKYIQSTIPIEKINEQMTYIESLNKQVITLQHNVTEARRKMEGKQTKLTEAHVEVRKFENIIESRINEQRKIALILEQETMDEISIQQFRNQKNR